MMLWLVPVLPLFGAALNGVVRRTNCPFLGITSRGFRRGASRHSLGSCWITFRA